MSPCPAGVFGRVASVAADYDEMTDSKQDTRRVNRTNDRARTGARQATSLVASA